MRVDPGAGGQDLSLSVAPVYGDVASGVARLWDHGTIGEAPANDNVAQLRLDAELGYGLSALGGRGVLTPFGGLSLLGDDGQRSASAGVWKSGRRSSSASRASAEAR